MTLGAGATYWPEEGKGAVVVMGRAAWRVEIEAHASTVTMRALPLHEGRKRLGAVILTRDVSEMRRREQELMTSPQIAHLSAYVP